MVGWPVATAIRRIIPHRITAVVVAVELASIMQVTIVADVPVLASITPIHHAKDVMAIAMAAMVDTEVADIC